MAKAAKSQSKTGKGRSVDREQRWDEIVHAAAAIFYEKGYEATSLQDIADAVGLLKGSIYYYIKTKEDLLFELVTRSQATWAEVLVEGEGAASASAADRMRDLARRWITLSNRDREWGIVAEREFSRLSPDHLARVIANRKTFSSFVEDIVKQGIAEGDFDPTLDLGLATDQVFALLKSSHQHRRPLASAAVDDVADAYAQFLIRGLGVATWKPEGN